MPTWTRDNSVSAIGARTFDIEVMIRDGNDNSAPPDVRVWVVSKGNHSRHAPLPVTGLAHSSDTSLMFNRFDVSSDEYAIIMDRKIASGTNEMRVYHRQGDLHYQFAEKQSLNERVAKQFGSVPKWQGWDSSEPYVDMVRFDRWLPNRRHAMLACLYNNFGDSPWKTIYYRVTLDTHTGKLSDHRHVPGQDVKFTYS